MSPPANALEPATLGGLQLRNRIIKTATFEGMSRGGRPSDDLLKHHETLAAGGVGMTTVAYAAVSKPGRTFGDQLVISQDSAEGLAAIADAVHVQGGAIGIQLGHCGGFTKLRPVGRLCPRGPSWGFNAYGALQAIPMVRPMSEADMEATAAEFATAAARVVDLGFDSVELHLGHGYLLSQFLSPVTNRRRDAYGGDLDGRLRFPLMVVRAVRAAVPSGTPVLAKINLSDGVPGGSTVDDAVIICNEIADAGVDGVVLSGGIVSRNAFYLLRGERPLGAMIRTEKNWLQKGALATFGPLVVRRYQFEPMFFLEMAREVRRQVDVPLVLLGGITGREHVDRAMQEGFDFVAMGRALISDPDLTHQMRDNPKAEARCDQCNLCVAKMDLGVRCWRFDLAES